MDVIPSYETIVAGFRDGLSKLSPVSAYVTLREMAGLLARSPDVNGSNRLESSEPAPSPARSPSLSKALASAYQAYAIGDSVGARQAVEAIIDGSERPLDTWSLADAKHLLGRLLFDEGRLPDAERTFLEILQMSRQLGYVVGFVRALHEISRVKAKSYELVDAEAGFRLSADYYALCLSRRHDPSHASSDDLARRNFMAALRCLSQLAESYFVISNGPLEGDRLIESLASDSFNVRDGSGDDFLIVRGLALKLFTAEAAEHHVTDLLAKGLALFGQRRQLSIFALDEAAWYAEWRGIAYPSKVRNIIAQPQSFSLRELPSFKPTSYSIQMEPPPLRHLTVDDAADSIQTLYEYLARLDGQGRYAYRGQTQDYDGPLLPSAFRPILKKDYGVATRHRSSFGGMRRLRDCGDSFLGDYNYCFSGYADVMREARDSEMEQTEIERIFGVYKQLLDDPSLRLAQDQQEFLPWPEAVRQSLSEPALQIYQTYAPEWNLRIDSYHKRVLRELLVRLFGYTLGTTFAQQFGLSSEGLDATKSLDVACFFATRDSEDFQSLPAEGVGVIYRFPFPTNDIAMQPLSAFNFYSLPSTIDVEDVFYRFEQEELEQPDAMSCILAYLGARLTHHADSTDILLLPRSFMASSRVKAQDAAIIIPDEIREDLGDRDPGVDGIRYPKFRYVEDLKTRPGLARFYFRHNGRGLQNSVSITRERLWPRDDFLLKTLILLVAGSYRLSQAIPKRLDLIDGGYSRDEFSSYTRELYKQYRHSFITPDENLARRSGVLVM